MLKHPTLLCSPPSPWPLLPTSKPLFSPPRPLPRPACQRFESCPMYSRYGEEGGDARPLLENKHGVHPPHPQQLHRCMAPACAAVPTALTWGLVQGLNAHCGFEKDLIFMPSPSTGTMSCNSEPQFPFIRCGGKKGYLNTGEGWIQDAGMF